MQAVLRSVGRGDRREFVRSPVIGRIIDAIPQRAKLLGYSFASKAGSTRVWLATESGFDWAGLSVQLSAAAGIEVEALPLRRFERIPTAAVEAAPAADVDVDARLGLASSVHCRFTPNGGSQVRANRGSVGAVLRVNGEHWILSANHVLAENGVLNRFSAPGDGVYATRANILASQSVDFVRIEAPPTVNEVDAAACKLNSNASALLPTAPAAWQAVPSHPVRPPEGTKVSFLSRMAGGVEREGIVDTALVDEMEVSMDVADLERLLFKGSILIRSGAKAFVKPGDSGSLVFAAMGGQRLPVGIAFARTVDDDGEMAALVCPFHSVLQLLGFSPGDVSILK
jgi:hypothetical protein